MLIDHDHDRAGDPSCDGDWSAPTRPPTGISFVGAFEGRALITCDFDGTSPVDKKGINVPLVYTKAYACYALKCAIAGDILCATRDAIIVVEVFALLAASQMVDGEIHGDPIQPSLHRRPPLEPLPMPPSPHHRLLHRILRIHH